MVIGADECGSCTEIFPGPSRTVDPSRKLSLYMIFNDFVRGQAKGARIGDGVMAVCVSHVNVKAKSSECGSWMACCKVLAPELPNKFSVPER